MKGAARRRKPGLDVRAIAQAAEAKAEAIALAQSLAQTARLELARGGQVEDAGGRLRLTSRDGLQTLHERGGLEQPEYAATPDCVQLRGDGAGQRPPAGGAHGPAAQ